jgi:phosphoglucomutase
MEIEEMGYRKVYECWLNKKDLDEELKQELKDISSNEKEIEDRFCNSLEFGTGGLRGIIGAGTNRMNKNIISRATQGLSQFYEKRRQGKEKGGRHRLWFPT